MAAPIGNEYYKLRTKDGRDKIFETPEDLVSACNEYFEWCIENPLLESVIVKGNRTEEVSVPTKDEEGKTKNVKSKTTIPYDIAQLPKMRAFTLHGLCNFIDISMDCFGLYDERKDFIGVTTRVRQIIYNQKFEGAASGFLNPNIIARDLGLTDKTDVKQTNINIDAGELSQAEADKLNKSIEGDY
jgi:hypothetical protein